MFFKKSKRLQFRRKSLTSTRYPHVSRFRKFEKIGEIPGTDGKSREFRNREGEGGGGVCKPGRSFASHWHLSYPANLEHVFPCVGWLHANARRMVIVHSYPPLPIFLFAAISLPRSAEPCFVSNGLSGSKSPPFDLFIAKLLLSNI